MGNDELTITESTELNRILADNEMRVGTIRIIPKDDFHFITVLNKDKGFKIPDCMKSTETRKSFTNREDRVIKVMWIMDLRNGQRLLSYNNPNTIKTLHNNKLQSEEVVRPAKLLVPDNVVVLWRLDVTYLIINGVETYDKAEVRYYA